MTGEDDDAPWETEYDDAADTQKIEPEQIPELAQSKEAIPEPVPSRDSTGKYKTLPGFAEAVEDTREHYEALGEIRGMKKVFTALRLLRIGAGDHPDTADVKIERLRMWMADNEKLIDEAMKD